jgi:phosphoribosylformimino-5-aminoimidazole carboxamide ribotide isomerase
VDVLPAIDLSGGRLAYLEDGRRAPAAAFDGDPLAAAASFLEAGAEWLHVVDMDLAFDGEAANAEVVWKISELGARVQASGGITRRDEVEVMLGAGAERVVLGSRSFEEPGEVELAVSEFGSRIVIGLESDGRRVQARGREEPGMELGEALVWLRVLGPSRLLYTGVSRVGGLAGLDLAGVRRVMDVVDVPVVVAGGVATAADVAAARETGAEGVVIGRGLYEGALKLRDALAAASGP